jgi:hypothetical protein
MVDAEYHVITRSSREIFRILRAVVARVSGIASGMEDLVGGPGRGSARIAWEYPGKLPAPRTRAMLCFVK